MVLVPVPGYGAGHLTPEGNLAIYLDKWIQGPFQDQTTYTWILSSLTFAATVMLGAFCGLWLRSERSKKQKVIGLVFAGISCTLLGWGWGLLFPIIKHLWTSSFVLYSGGLCILLLALFYLVIDVWGYRKWAFPFKVIGMNAIAVYMATMVFDFRLIGDVFVGGLEKYLMTGFPFVQSLAAFAVVWLILYFLYRQRIFIKI
jgi:predicted acyltransferase